MKKRTIEEKRRCPKCGQVENQVNKGYNRSGTQRCMCKDCGVSYTLNPKQNEYSEETKELALRIYYSGVSGRGVGKILRMNKSNVYNWIQKNDDDVDNSFTVLELDELYWFISEKARTETRENVYVMTAVSRQPRQIVGFDVAVDKSSHTIQAMVDQSPPAQQYCTDGYVGYLDVVYPGKHVRNVHDKRDTFTVEGVNADLRHYIPILARKSRCFARKIETLRAVLEVFVHAYNRFGRATLFHRLTRPTGDIPFSVLDFL